MLSHPKHNRPTVSWVGVEIGAVIVGLSLLDLSLSVEYVPCKIPLFFDFFHKLLQKD